MIKEWKLDYFLWYLFIFGDVVVYLSSFYDLVSFIMGDCLCDLLNWLGIEKRFVYYYLWDIIGILSNVIYNVIFRIV